MSPIAVSVSLLLIKQIKTNTGQIYLSLNEKIANIDLGKNE
jgi:hypothetical protein